MHDELGTLGSSGTTNETVISGSQGANVIQASRIGGASRATKDVLLFEGAHGDGDTIGGPTPGEGNTFTEGLADFDGSGEVLQGNTFRRVTLYVGDNSTLGGPATTAGAAPGNDIGEELYGASLGRNDVVQGNHIHGALHAALVLNGSDTIGGSTSPDGNLIDGNGSPPPQDVANGAIAVGQAAGRRRRQLGSVIEHNRIVNNHGAGVDVYHGIGNTVRDNFMFGNVAGIQLGTEYAYNSFNGYLTASSDFPNHLQPYPDILDVKQTGSHVTIAGQLDMGVHHGHDGYTIDVYSQATGCSRDSISPGQGEGRIARLHVTTDSLGSATFKLNLPSLIDGEFGGGPLLLSAITATATSGDGSTSEFSPCLSMGHHAAGFARAGVSLPEGSVAVGTVTTGKPATVRLRRAALTAARTSLKLTATLRPFCPPVTVGYCAGTLVLRRPSSRKPFARLQFKLVPGQLGTLGAKLPGTLSSILGRSHRARVVAAISAHDGARHAHRKTTSRSLTLAFSGHA